MDLDERMEALVRRLIARIYDEAMSVVTGLCPNSPSGPEFLGQPAILPNKSAGSGAFVATWNTMLGMEWTMTDPLP